MSSVRQEVKAIHGFRDMTDADISAVMEIEKVAYEFPWSEGIMRDCLRVGYCCRVLEIHGEIRAYGVMSHGAGEAHILNLCVHPDFQNRGLGRLVMDHLLDLAHRLHALVVLLEVRPSNHRAIRLYRSLGFNEVGSRKQYYPGHGETREDALIMAKELFV
ncbi:MAG TPA: ribosomal-protein-alanine N-acetyltransferase [Thiotrichales bacterium]|nr:ribosomal-protein-alanine N-acetyltransferase [Thiotrichales bacterium]